MSTRHSAASLAGFCLILCLAGCLLAQDKPIERHDKTLAPPLKDRPAKGHIGFQELSRGGTHVLIRNAKIKVLDR